MLCNAGMLRTLPYLELCYIQNIDMFRILFIQTNSGIFRISGIFDNDSYNNINFLFFDFNTSYISRNLTYFSTKFKKAYMFLTTMTSFKCSIEST